MADPESLAGGMGNGGSVVRLGDTVRRPASANDQAISLLLEALSGSGVEVPKLLGRDEQGRGVFKWIDGQVPVAPYPAWALTDETLASVGRLLRRYHDAVETISLPAEMDWSQEMPDPRGGSIICHNDVCPENVVFRDGEAVGLLDFDFAAPGRPIWDLAQTARMWVPLRPAEFNGERSHLDQFARLRVLAKAYGLEAGQHRELVEAVIESRRAGSRFVQRRVHAGEVAFVDAWARHGGAEGDAQILSWLEEHADQFMSAPSTHRVSKHPAAANFRYARSDRALVFGWAEACRTDRRERAWRGDRGDWNRGKALARVAEPKRSVCRMRYRRVGERDPFYVRRVSASTWPTGAPPSRVVRS